MNLNDYQTAALRTAMEKTPREIIEYCAHGLAGEAGEVSEIIKKHYYHGHDLDPQQLMDECGDILWYTAILTYALGFTLGYTAEHNIAKLARRYPEGFSEERSQNRVEYGCNNCALYSYPGEHCKTAINGKPCTMLEEI